MHKLEKFMGPVNTGGGRFVQKYRCTKCGKVAEKSS
jgi:hypothetical protein